MLSFEMQIGLRPSRWPLRCRLDNTWKCQNRLFYWKQSRISIIYQLCFSWCLFCSFITSWFNKTKSYRPDYSKLAFGICRSMISKHSAQSTGWVAKHNIPKVEPISRHCEDNLLYHIDAKYFITRDSNPG